MSTRDTLGKRLAAAREAAQKTQHEIGEAAGVSGAAVSAWEVGRTQPSSIQLAAVCKLLKVKADHLLGIEKSRV